MEKLNAQSVFNSLQPELISLDEERLIARGAILRTNLIFWPFVAVGFGIFAYGVSQATDSYTWIGIGVSFIFFLILAVKKMGIKSKFARTFKERVISKIIKKLDAGLKYSPDLVIHRLNDDLQYMRQLTDSRLFHSFGRCKSEDAINGKMKDSNFDFREVTLETGGKNSKVVFQGIVIKVDLRNSITTPVYILPDSANQIRDSLWKMLNLKSKRGEVVLFDHEMFEKLFKVYADDATLATSLLKRNLLDKLVAIHDKIVSLNPVRDSISLAFSGNTVTIAVKLKVNLFEPRLNEPINDPAYFEKNVQYLTLFMGLVEDLDFRN